MSHTKPNQCERILRHLRHRGHSLSQREAVIYLDCYRLAARIHELRKQGHKINKTMKRSTKDKGVAYAVYRLEGV